MSNIFTAIEYLADPKRLGAASVVIAFGDDPFFPAEVFKTFRDRLLGAEDAEFSLTCYDVGERRGASAASGDEAPQASDYSKPLTFLDLITDVSTRALFGDAPRLVRVTGAEKFLAKYSSEMETYLDAPAGSGVLFFQTATLAANTRLYKKTAEAGALVDCRAPAPGVLPAWLVTRAKQEYGVAIATEAAQLLVDSVGAEAGLLDQEVARLAVDPACGKTITARLVRERVGGWRVRKVWDMIDAFLGGDIPNGIRQLDRLLASGESPVGLLAQVGTTLRRFAAATNLFLEAERHGRRVGVADALLSAGIPPFVVKKSAEQMIKLGRARGAKLSAELVATDLAMKGGSRSDPRLILEQFLIRLGHPALKNG